MKTAQRLLRRFSLIAVVILATLSLLDGWSDYKQAKSTAFARLEVEARLLAEHAELSLAAAELVLGDVVGLVRDAGLHEVATAPAYTSSLRRRLDNLPQLSSLALIDADGQVRFWTGGAAQLLGHSLARRGYFQSHRSESGLLVSAPVIGAGSGRRLVPVSMGLAAPGEPFAGVVVAMLDVAYFERFYALLPAASQRKLLTYHDNGILLTRHQSAGVGLAQVERVSPNWAPADQGMAAWGGYGEDSLYVRRALRGYPVEVAVGRPRAVFVSELWAEWLRTTLVFLLLAGGTLVATRVVRRAVRTAQYASQQQLRQAREQRRSERLAREITRHLPNGRVVVLDEQLHYVFAEGQGLADEMPGGAGAEEIVGRRIEEVHPPRSAEPLRRIALSALAGAESEGEFEYRGCTYKATGVPLRDDTGEVEQVLLLAQDISEFKRIQRELEERNQQLQELSYTDGLLDIANRRAFDEALAREWRRARRKSLSLALLLVDVDRFKLYNDSYGHSEGDEALLRVSKALQRAVVRPSDLVARYGGEEFVVLLPDTDAQGAARVAARIHQRLLEANVPFPVAPTPGRLTVSIGLTAGMARPGSDMSELLEAADRALYEAKDRGRNRTVASEGSHV